MIAIIEVVSVNHLREAKTKAHVLAHRQAAAHLVATLFDFHQGNRYC